MLEVINPFMNFVDKDGKPLQDGAIYIGVAGFSPLDQSQTVYWDSGANIPAAQPIKTLNGYPTRDGTPANLYVAANAYSIAVYNKRGALVFAKSNVSFTGALATTSTDGLMSAADKVKLDAALTSATGFAALGLGTAATGDASQLVPIGMVFFSALNFVPVGYLACNGAAVSRSAYANLFAAIGTTYGVGDGITTFNVPDLRGEFIRGFDAGRGVDSGRVFASAQGHQFQDHYHAGPSSDQFVTSNAGAGAGGPLAGGGSFKYNLTATSGNAAFGNYGSETRPRNVALLAIIKT